MRPLVAEFKATRIAESLIKQALMGPNGVKPAPAPVAPPASTPATPAPTPPPAPVQPPAFQPYDLSKLDFTKHDDAWNKIRGVNDWYKNNAQYQAEQTAGAQNPDAVWRQRAFGLKGDFNPNDDFLRTRLAGYKSYADAADDVKALEAVNPGLATQYGLAAAVRFGDTDAAAKDAIKRYGTELSSAKAGYADLSPEQKAQAEAAHRQFVDRGLALGGRAKLTGEQAGWFDRAKNWAASDNVVANKVRDTITGAATDTATKIKETNKIVAESVQKNGLLDWIMSDPKVLAVPAGLIAMMFGGKIGAVVGALAVGYGGYNLFNRYKTLKSDEFAPVYQEFLGQGAETLKKTDVETAINQFTPTLQARAQEQVANMGQQFADQAEMQKALEGRVGQMQQGIRDMLYLSSTAFGQGQFNNAVDAKTQAVVSGFQ